MKVGSVVTLRIPCLGNPAGTAGVCYEIYTLGRGTEGCSFIFANGSYDGFSKEDQDAFLSHVYDSDLQYEFSNVMKLSRDFDSGVVDRYLVILFKDRNQTKERL